MRNRKGLFAFLIVGGVIIGLLTMFNYGLAVVGDPPEGTPTPTPTKTVTPLPSNDLSIDFSGLKAGIAGKPYSGVIKAKNAKNPKWTLGNNNLSEFGLTAPAISFGGSFSIKSINSTSVKEGTATGTVTLISRIGKAEGGGIETDEISGDFKIEIKKGIGSGSIISPKINSFTVNGSRSVKATEGDEIEFKWAVRDDTIAGLATSVEILGRLTPQSDQDPAGQQNICVKAGQDKCGLSGSAKVKIYRSSAFTLKAKNTLNGKSKTATSAVYVIVKPKPPEKFGTVVVEGTLDGNPYTGRVTPADAFKFFKNSAEQEKININSLPKVFNRAKGNYKIETEIDKFQLFSATGKKIPASLKDISSASGELKSGGTVRFGVNFISKAIPTPTPTPTPVLKYTCNSDNQCVVSPTGEYGKSNCNNKCVEFMPTPTPSETPTPTPEGSQPDLGKAYDVLKKVLDDEIPDDDIKSCPTWPFLDEAVKQLRVADNRWGYHNYPKTKKSLVVSQDRIAWYSGSGEPVNGSSQVLAYDIISDYCTSKAKLRKPSLVHSSEFNYKDQWKFPREKSSMIETSESVGLETEELTPTPDLAVVGEALAPNKSLIARGLDAVDTIALPVQFYTEKFFRDMTDASFWKKVKKGLEIKKSPLKKKLKSTPSPTK